jgi:hypothetical protein
MSNPTESIATGSWDAIRLELQSPPKGARFHFFGELSIGCTPAYRPSIRRSVPRVAVAGENQVHARLLQSGQEVLAHRGQVGIVDGVVGVVRSLAVRGVMPEKNLY